MKDFRSLADFGSLNPGGKGGIRTLGGPKPTTVFETVPFNHSGTFPFCRADIILLYGGEIIT